VDPPWTTSAGNPRDDRQSGAGDTLIGGGWPRHETRGKILSPTTGSLRAA
jgi:hypothetical protein